MSEVYGMQELQVNALFDLSNTIAAPLLVGVTYPWEALPQLADFIRQTGATLPSERYEKRGEDVWVAKSATVAENASITGPCIICEEAEVRHCAFIRGSVIVGAGAVVGNSTELKNCILFDEVEVPHFNYVGDSILGYKAHMGGGAMTSNIKSDKTPVSVVCNGERIQTGYRKLGAILGDLVEVGAGSVLNPGTVIAPRTNVYPLSMVCGFVPADSIYKTGGVIVKKQ